MLDLKSLLSSFFGEDMLDLILEPNTLKVKQNVKELLIKNKNTPKHLKDCKGCDFQDRDKKMDFPAWSGDLNTNDIHKKEIMVIGISPNGLDYPVHIAYGLNYDFFPGTDINKLDKDGARKFWKMMCYFFNNDRNYIHENIYITDMAYCDCKSNNYKTFKMCSQKHLMEEIEFVNPKLLIIHGFVTNKIMRIFPRPSVIIPHVQGRGALHYPFNYDNPDQGDPIWKEAKDYIQKFLND